MNLFSKWLNEAPLEIQGQQLKITAPAKTDYFINPVTGEAVLNAPYYYEDVRGDFVLRTQVKHDFRSTFDAAALLVMENDHTWAKLCFELTDLGTKSIVSVVTHGVSDDANGPNLDTNTVWLQMARKGDVFAMHYSLDGQKFDMVRLFKLPVSDTVKVGIVAQSPTGDGLICEFSYLMLKREALQDLRKGV